MKTLRVVAAGAIAIALGALAWYWAPGRVFAANLDSAVASRPGALVNIDNLTPFSWESVVFFGPYTDPSVVRDVLGFEWPLYKLYGLEYSDSFSLVLFLRGGGVANFATVRRCSPDFSRPALATKFTHQTAVFRVDSSTGCITLTPQQLQSSTSTAMVAVHAF